MVRLRSLLVQCLTLELQWLDSGIPSLFFFNFFRIFNQFTANYVANKIELMH